MTVHWKMSSLFPNANADKCYREITSIGDAATPKQILDYGRNPNTELHKCFEWDDSVAAEHYRLQQARTIVCHLVITESSGDDHKPQSFRLLQNTENGYKPVKMIFQNKSEYEKLLENARNELRSFKQRYSQLTELEEILALID